MSVNMPSHAVRNKMSDSEPGLLVQKTNHGTGKLEWKLVPEDYDYSQELARAAFADMLHDEERNNLYREGLKAAIQAVRERGEKVRVLDIGTGTGLLSMMAAVEGVDSIVACEEFRPMAECAARIIEGNGFKDKIKLVRKRSTELTVGPGCDMEERANILVTEVFDTELIGEGAIGTYNHANLHLLTEDRLVVPGVARMYAQVVECRKASSWSRLHSIKLDTGDILDTGDTHTISNLVLHDLQLSQLDETLFTPLSDPIQVFNFDLACRTSSIPLTETRENRFLSHQSGVCTAVFVWWDCFTDPECRVLISCAPRWNHPQPKNMAWRDHWMQAVYYPQVEVHVKQGEELYLQSNHDEFSLWFDVNKVDGPVTSGSPVYLPMSRTRLGQVNCSQRNSIYVNALNNCLKNGVKDRVLCLGDQSLLGLLAAKLGFSRITVVQENNKMKETLANLAQNNDVGDRLTFVSDLQGVSEPFNLVIGDPFYSVSVLPWHSLLFWFQLHSLTHRDLISEQTVVLPGTCSIWVLPVHYEHLWKIRAPLNTIQGFDMRHFDSIIEKASENCDLNVEPHPLWEYPCVALGTPHKVAEFKLTDWVPDHTVSFTGEISVTSTQLDLNGLALWCDWGLGANGVLSSGPNRVVEVGERVSWSMDDKQGVHFFKNPTRGSDSPVQYEISFTPAEGDFTFAFSR